MTTKNDCLFSKGKKNSTVFDAYKGTFKSWNNSSDLCLNTLKLRSDIKRIAEKRKKKDNSYSINSRSTLSLHIAAFERFVEAASSDAIKWGNTKEIFSASSFTTQVIPKNPFEYPRQQNEGVSDPEVSHFSASQQLLSPNEPSPSRTRKSMTKQEKQEEIRKWKAGYLESKPALRGNYTQIVENNKVVAQICIHCESYFIGNKIGSAQRNHECIKKLASFTTAQKQTAKDSSLKLVKTDLLPFAVVHKPGLLEFAKSMLEIGADLGHQNIKDLTIADVKSLMPHPTTLSNHINAISTKKPQLYAILKRKSNESGISLMIDGTSKSYHYTGIHISFIDENWKFQTLLINLIAGHGKGETTAAYVQEKTTEFLAEFGIDISLINAFITDEAAAMLAAFANSEKLIVCGCHMVSTICKHTVVLYAKDKVEQPQVHEELQNVCELKKKLKEVVTAIRSRIYVNKNISHPLYQANETRFLSFTTSLQSFLSLTAEDHQTINDELSSHNIYPRYLELVEAKNDLTTIYNTLYPTISILRTLEVGNAPTLHLVLPCFARLYREWENIADWSDPIEYSMKTAGLLAIKEKVPNLTDLHYFATVLDPNVKKDFKTCLIPDRTGHTREITEIIPKLRAAVKSYILRTRRYRPRIIVAADDDNPFAEVLTSAQPDSLDLIVDNEIDKYLADKGASYSTTILDYWRTAAGHYPVVGANVVRKCRSANVVCAKVGEPSLLQVIDLKSILIKLFLSLTFLYQETDFFKNMNAILVFH